MRCCLFLFFFCNVATGTEQISEIKQTIIKTGKEFELPDLLLSAIVWQESSFRPDAFNGNDNPGVAVSSYGLGQLTLDTAAWHCQLKEQDIYHPLKNLKCSAKVLKWQLDRFKGDIQNAISAYNMGTPCICNGQNYVKTIRKKVKNCRQKKTLLPLGCSRTERGKYWNQKYVSEVLSKMKELKLLRRNRVPFAPEQPEERLEKVESIKPSLASLKVVKPGPFITTESELQNFYNALLKKIF